ncbi:MAG: hypothetical protein AAF512_03270 [Pseudomonadota bacterium]
MSLIRVDMNVEYTFTMEDGKELYYKIPFNREQDTRREDGNSPEWTKLDFQQCSNCPLNKEDHPHCPVALDAHEIIAEFKEILSFKEMDVKVGTPEREYFKHCDAQTGLRSLIGFVMATSACPILSPLRGMAHYHLPFASLDETLFRVASAYLLEQYFVYKEGEKPDLELDGLKEQYQDIQTLNYDFLQRIRVASEADANLDVLSTLFSIASLISFNLDAHLSQLKPLFALNKSD